MTRDAVPVSLGFTDQTFPAGVHICQIFGSDSERIEAIEHFVCSGLKAGERTACFSERLDHDHLSCRLADHGVSHRDCVESGALMTASPGQVYFQDQRFDPDRIIATVRQFHLDSVALGYPAARVIGEMTAEIQTIPGGERLLEYESRISLLLKDHPVTAVCQYDATAFDGATIMQVLKVHPLMVIRGVVIHNPFFMPPEEILARRR